jgi:hypothetical protein
VSEWRASPRLDGRVEGGKGAANPGETAGGCDCKRAEEGKGISWRWEEEMTGRPRVAVRERGDGRSGSPGRVGSEGEVGLAG